MERSVGRSSAIILDNFLVHLCSSWCHCGDFSFTLDNILHLSSILRVILFHRKEGKMGNVEVHKYPGSNGFMRIVITFVFFMALVIGMALWMSGHDIIEKSYENVQRIWMDNPNEITIFVRTADKKIKSVFFTRVQPIIIEDAPIDGPMRVEYKNCDAPNLKGCLEMHVHSLKEVEHKGRATIPMPDI